MEAGLSYRTANLLKNKNNTTKLLSLQRHCMITSVSLLRGRPFEFEISGDAAMGGRPGMVVATYHSRWRE